MKSSASRIVRAWVFYDWANSVYPLIISSAIFPVVYENATSIKINGKTVYDNISFFGHLFKNTEFYAYLVCVSYLVVALLTPLLSGIADAGGKRKGFMQFFCFLGAVSSGLLYFFPTKNPGIQGQVMELGWSIIPLFFGSIGFWGSLVYYNSYLPEIASPEAQDKVSARGFTMGYLGSSILLITILIVFVFQKIAPISWAFPLVSIWWIGFALYSFYHLPKTPSKHYTSLTGLCTAGFKEISKVFYEIRTQHLPLKRFLYSYFMFNMAVQTIMVMAVSFASKEIIGIKPADLITSILLIQFLGVAGAFLMALISKKIGNIKTLMLSIMIWIAICVYVYQFVYKPWQFYIAAAFVGLVMGGIQSNARSTYSKLLPQTQDPTSYFSFFDLAEKIGLAIGTFSFGLIEGFLNIRSSILALIVFFVLGLLLLLRVPKSEKLSAIK
ncbi:MAG: MFS transporter [Sphingobacteriia bacterium]|nr:MFS transporter [Sphingobacteriia bacterium]